MNFLKRNLNLLERVIPFLFLLILLTFSYVKFFEIPYTGFYFNPDSGLISDVYVLPNGTEFVQEGDEILSINGTSLLAFQLNVRLDLWDQTGRGDVVPIIILRNGEELTIPWQIPGFNENEFWGRVLDVWWLAYIFWLSGTATLLFVRPKGTQWWLLILFNYATAVWLMTGTVSASHLWQGAVVLRIAFWLALPIYLHLHWVFPKPLAQIPGSIWKSIYAVIIVLSVMEWFQLLPVRSYLIAALGSFLGSLLLLLGHLIFQPQQRRRLAILFGGMAAAFLPIAGLAFLGLTAALPSIGALTLIALPFIPLAYFYIAYTGQPGWIEFRVNQLVTLYLVILIFLIPSVGLNTALITSSTPDASLFINVLYLAVAITAVILGFTRFQAFVERYILGIPLLRQDVIASFTSHITTTLDLESLKRIMIEEILPSLLVRESALLFNHVEGELTSLFLLGIMEEQLPNQAKLNAMLHQGDVNKLKSSEQWIRFVVPLKAENEINGLWLLGRKDPDDLYSKQDKEMLDLLAAQTSIALTNIKQAQQLRALYTASINRQEAERTQLARFLHDQVLNELGTLALYQDQIVKAPHFQEAYHMAINRIRQIIVELRPTMLIYGLWGALDELVENINERLDHNPSLRLNVPETTVRHQPDFEQHLFRIVQQAVENAILHANATMVHINGELQSDHIHLTISDNGRGIKRANSLNLQNLLLQNHFGLVGMYERCQIIDAKMTISSEPGQGTQISIIWPSTTAKT